MFDNYEKYTNKEDLPPLACVYAVFAGKVAVYVGFSNNLRATFRNHGKAKDFKKLLASDIKWKTTTHNSKFSENLKSVFVQTLNPVLNVDRKERACKMAKLEIEKSTLARKTHDLLILKINKYPSRAQGLDAISIETGLTFAWLDYFARNSESSPAVDRIETLYNYLSPKKLKV